MTASVLSLEALRETVEGSVIGPDDARYDEARSLFYTGFDRRPACVVRPVDATDVARVVTFASEGGFPLSIRGGGHSMSGQSVCDDGIVLDLSSFRGLDIDVEGRTAWVGSGLTAGEYTVATSAQGLATGFGDAPTVGIGGITLSGGVGFLHRRFGLTIDSLLAADLVTAEGEQVRADERSHPDLFWALRGGGGNFGVVTRLHFRLHEVDSITGGMLILPATPATIEAFIHESLAAPDEIAGMANVTIAPPMPFVPPDVHGKPIIMAILVHAAGGEAAERAFARFRRIATPVVDGIRPMRYPAIYDGHEDAPRPPAVVVRSTFRDTLERSVADAILDGLHSSTAPMRVCQVRVLGGAVARVPNEATAFAHRTRGMILNVGAIYQRPEEVEEHQTWANRLAAGLTEGDRGAYVAFMGDEGDAGVRNAYPGPTGERLARVKKQYDPTNLFRFNQNIRPAQ